MTAAAQPHTPPSEQPPYLAGDRIQVLYMSARGTILADARVLAVSPRPDGTFRVHTVMSAPRASFHLVPDGLDRAIALADPRVTVGVDHTKPSE